MKLKEITEILERVVPHEYACDWDNVGMAIGSMNSEINKVMVTLDITNDVVSQAIDARCDLIISHHPLFFKGVNKIDFDTSIGNTILRLIKNNISVYSCHTNMDASNIGINVKLAELFELDNLCLLEENNSYSDVGMGRIGDLKQSLSVEELCEKAKSLLNASCLRVVNSYKDKYVKRLCVASGSCGDMIKLAAEKGADAIITADVKYHEALESSNMNIAVIDAGHFYTEYLVTDILIDILKSLKIEVIKASAGDVFNFV